MTTQLGTRRGRYDEHSSKFFLSKNQGLSIQYEKAKLKKVMLASFATALDNLLGALSRLCFAPAAMWNLHTIQPNTLLLTYDEVVNLTGLL
jgi:hypothetical protein